MYFGIYEDYRTKAYLSEKEAVLDIVAYMESKEITGDFKIYTTIRIDAKEIINPLCEAEILQLIKYHTKETYGELAKDYLTTMGAGAYSHFRYMLGEFKSALVSYLKNYKLEPMWERIMTCSLYRYDSEKKAWKFIEEIKYEKPPVVEPSEPTPIEPEPIEPVEPEPVEPDTPTEPTEPSTDGGDNNDTTNEGTNEGNEGTESTNKNSDSEGTNGDAP